ncbi:MAG TPA: FAD-binding oxidoreductase [Candidatus Sulfotelmatobacter sp.]|nr:FAD-binding oxidoreductase [Candidatus Sulfotelmatobacter sp.]
MLTAVQKVQEIVGAENAAADERLESYRLGARRPRVAARPTDEGEVSALLGLAAAERWGVVPWGSGLHQCIGARPTRYDLALDLRRMDRILGYEPADLTVSVQAGIRLRDLDAALAAAGQLLGLDPPLAEPATLGGVLAADLSGPLRCQYGTARDLVLGARVAHADGVLTTAGVRVVKNATGYDVTKLYLGSLGTLAVLLEVSLRLFPRPQAEESWWVPTRDLTEAHSLAQRVLGSHLRPDRAELLDPEAAKGLGIGNGPGLLASFAGVAEAVSAQGGDVVRWAAEAGTLAQSLGRASAIWQRCRDFPWRPTPGTARATWRAGALPADSAKALLALRDAMGAAGKAAAIASVAHGTLRGEIAAEEAALPRLLGAVRSAIEALGGYLVVLDLPETIRAEVDVWGPPSDGYGLMRGLKTGFDPAAVLNPGRFAGGL